MCFVCACHKHRIIKDCACTRRFGIWESGIGVATVKETVCRPVGGRTIGRLRFLSWLTSFVDYCFYNMIGDPDVTAWAC